MPGKRDRIGGARRGDVFDILEYIVIRVVLLLLVLVGAFKLITSELSSFFR
jgi:hypothetical protein